jgi:membrane-bound lytic murein transglycosylase D
VPDRTPLEVKRPGFVAKARKKGKGKSTIASAKDSAEKKFHIVKKGENLSSIAKKYEISVATLTKLNKLRAKSRLKLGTKLVLPENQKL